MGQMQTLALKDDQESDKSQNLGIVRTAEDQEAQYTPRSRKLWRPHPREGKDDGSLDDEQLGLSRRIAHQPVLSA